MQDFRLGLLSRVLGQSEAWKRRPRTFLAMLAAASAAAWVLAASVAPASGAGSSLRSSPNRNQEPEAAVRASVEALLDAWTNGDFESLAGHYHSEVRGFFLEGAPLTRGFDPVALQMAWEAGLRADISLRELDVRIHGDAAVSVAYVDGSISLPGGQPPVSGTWRYSETRVSAGGGWKVVQYHFSRLAEGP